MHPFHQIAKNPRSNIVRIGNREIITQGLNSGFWTDLYHRSMAVSWPVFFASAALVFIALNGTFALVFFLGPEPIANSGGFMDLFYFSIETLATVGYGDMHPQTHFGHFVAAVEIFTGMSLLAVMTGLIFARFSRPRARFVFAQKAVVTMHDRQPTLMIRMANARHNMLSNASATLWLIRAEQSAEGLQLRRYHRLSLLRQENPVFALTWTVFHVIDQTSPLFGLSAEDLASTDAVLLLTVSGIDDNSANALRARKSYSHDDVAWQYRYVDIVTVTEDGRLFIDYARFHDVTPDGASAYSADTGEGEGLLLVPVPKLDELSGRAHSAKTEGYRDRTTSKASK
jgi:inward rectifier potassium channel